MGGGGGAWPRMNQHYVILMVDQSPQDCHERFSVLHWQDKIKNSGEELL